MNDCNHHASEIPTCCCCGEPLFYDINEFCKRITDAENVDDLDPLLNYLQANKDKYSKINFNYMKEFLLEKTELLIAETRKKKALQTLDLDYD